MSTSGTTPAADLSVLRPVASEVQPAQTTPVKPVNGSGNATKPATNPAPRKPRVWHSHTHLELKEMIKNAPDDLIRGWVPEKSVNLLVGDSGLGKTPFLMQMGECVVEGLPFLGCGVQLGAVLYVDYENPDVGFNRALDRIKAFLGVDPDKDQPRFRRCQSPANPQVVREDIENLRETFPDLPILVLIDSLRGFSFKAEGTNEAAAETLTKLDLWAKQLNCSFVIMHHTRKDNPKEPMEKLEDEDIMTWLLAASGARALVNQTMVRLGIDTTARGGAELIVKGHYKMIGPFGPYFIGRVLDEGGDAVGYQRVTGVRLLTSEQAAVFSQLGKEFRYKELAMLSKKNPKVVSEWLHAWLGAGLIEKRGERKQTKYCKLAHRSRETVRPVYDPTISGKPSEAAPPATGGNR